MSLLEWSILFTYLTLIRIICNWLGCVTVAPPGLCEEESEYECIVVGENNSSVLADRETVKSAPPSLKVSIYHLAILLNVLTTHDITGIVTLCGHYNDRNLRPALIFRLISWSNISYSTKQ